MADLRTYIGKTTSLNVTLVAERVDAARVRVKAVNSAGKTVVSEVLSNGEADALRGALAGLVVPPPPPPPPPTVATYTLTGPWYAPVGDAATDPNSAGWVNGLLASPGGKLTSDPDQYAGPIYRTDGAAPLRRVVVSGSFNVYANGDTKPRTSTVGSWGTTDTIELPIPDTAVPSNGSDGHVILHDTVNGVEYGFWQFERAGDTIYVTNGYKVPFAGSHGSFQDGKSGRGAGTPYGAGCFRKEDMAADAVPHALAIALNYPCKNIIRWPASKTDGAGPASMPPEGARMVLDPDFNLDGFHPVAAKALAWCKSHGAYVIDNSGRNKLYFEDRSTAGWDGGFGQYSVSGVPWSAWRFVVAPVKP